MVKSSTDRRAYSRFAIAGCIFFFLTGQALIPLLGVQNDEALFGYAFFRPRTGFAVQLGHSPLPLMLMSYLGTLKAWIYRPVFAVFQPGIWSLREPALLAGVGSIWLSFLLLRRIAGGRAGVIGCGLLVTDALFLLTVCFDWGPVALQHLLLVGGMYLLVRFYQEGRTGPLFGGFLLFGLAMWDKALAAWMLGGFGVAALVVFPRQIWGVTTPRRVGVAVLAFALGALPLIIYNVDNQFSTFRGQDYSAREMGSKARLLAESLRGAGGLMGWMVNEDGQAKMPHAAGNLLEGASAKLSSLAGRPRHSLQLYAFVVALLLIPLARGGELRAILFALVAMAVQWLQMAMVVGAGGSVHHSILIWPLPQMIIAISFAAASRRLGRAGRPVAAGVLAVLMLSGVLLINEYYRMAWRNGGGVNWTDAIYPLSDYLKRAPAGRVYCMDWGMLDSLRVLGRGRLPLDLPPDPPDDVQAIRRAAGAPDHLFVAHEPGFEFFPETNARFLKAAEAAGFRRKLVAVIADSYGMPAYDLYRFE